MEKRFCDKCQGEISGPDRAARAVSITIHAFGPRQMVDPYGREGSQLDLCGKCLTSFRQVYVDSPNALRLWQAMGGDANAKA